MSDEQSRATVDRAWERGVRMFDTAPHYGLGLSERRMGAALESRPREDYELSTKVGRLLVRRDDPLARDDDGFDVPGDMERQWDFSPEGVRRSLEESLDRTGLDRVDVLYVHDPDQACPGAAREGLAALRRLRQDGLVTAVGVGTNSTVGLRELIEEGLLDVLMLAGRHTLLDHGAVASVLEPALHAGVRVTAVGIFGSGLLATPRPRAHSTFEYRPVDSTMLARAQALAVLCDEHGIDLPTAALAFPLRHSAVSRVAVGLRSPEEVDHALRRLAVTVPDEFWEALVEHGHVTARAAGLS